MLLSVESVWAGNDKRRGTAGATQLLVNPWARSNGWGGANVASVRGLDAFYSNIAGLSFINKIEATYSNTMLYGGNSGLNSGGTVNGFGLAIRMFDRGVLGLSIMLTTPIIADRDHAQASMAPSVTAPQSQPLGMTVQEGVVPQAFTYFGTDATFGGVGNTSGKYYMVIATLRNQQELDAFKAKYASLVPHMKMLDYKGMTCVYVARSDNYEELMSLRDALPEALRDVWIYN